MKTSKGKPNTSIKPSLKSGRANSKKISSKSIKNTLRRRSGAAYVEVILSIFLITTLITVFLFIPPTYTHKQNLDYMGTKLVRAVEVTGEINEEIHDLARELADEMGLNITGYRWETQGGKVIGEGDPAHKLALREAFTLVLKSSRTATYFEIPATIHMTTTLTGVSEVYHKN